MIVKLHQGKLKYFQELSTISTEMASFSAEELGVDDEALENFTRLLHKREEIIGKIEEINNEILQSDEANDAVALAPLQEEILREGAKIAEENKLIETVVKVSLGHLREKTKKLQEGKQSNRAYMGRVSTSEGSFIDKRR